MNAGFFLVAALGGAFIAYGLMQRQKPAAERPGDASFALWIGIIMIAFGFFYVAKR